MNALLLAKLFKKPAGVAAAAGAGLVMVLLSGTVVVLDDDPATAGTCATNTNTDAAEVAGARGRLPGRFGRWQRGQVRNAALIVAAGKQRHVPARGWVIAVATAMQESTLHNRANDNPAYPLAAAHSLALPHDGVGHDYDSVGVFQQRPSPPEGDGGWGPVKDLMNVPTAAGKFYRALRKVKGWQRMRLTDAAQAVQRSVFPDRYQRWEDDAEHLVAALQHVSSIDQIRGASLERCDTVKPGQVSSRGWVVPVKAHVGSGFRPPDRPGHDGVDLLASRHTAIHAAAAGEVITAVCNSSIGTCDRDGGMNVLGCGWYVEIQHPGKIVTRYCHMVRRPEVSKGDTVTAGQVIGFVGSSGNSSGPHLHFEIHIHAAPATQANAVNPTVFLKRVGVHLGMTAGRAGR